MGESAPGPESLVPVGTGLKDLELPMLMADEEFSASGTTLEGCFFTPTLEGRPPGHVLVALIAAVKDAPKSYRLPKA